MKSKFSKLQLSVKTTINEDKKMITNTQLETIVNTNYSEKERTKQITIYKTI